MDMKVTEVRVKLAAEDDDKLLGYCSITLNNAFVVKDLKIIQGDNMPFIAMPSRKITDKCHKCGYKNHLRAKYCNECGGQQNPNRAELDDRGRAKLHFDLVHPIRSDVRDYVHQTIIDAYTEERERASQPVTKQTNE
ncbi:MAG: SpoVG family protein [Planctomycetota bacterium]